MEVLSAHLKNIRVPCGTDNVYKDECVYSYDTPVSGFFSWVLFNQTKSIFIN